MICEIHLSHRRAGALLGHRRAGPPAEPKELCRGELARGQNVSRPGGGGGLKVGTCFALPILRQPKASAICSIESAPPPETAPPGPELVASRLWSWLYRFCRVQRLCEAFAKVSRPSAVDRQLLPVPIRHLICLTMWSDHKVKFM